MKSIFRHLVTLSILAVACTTGAMARETIQVEISVGGPTSTRGFDSIDAMLDSFEYNPEAYYGAGFDLTNPMLDFTANIDILGFQMRIVTTYDTEVVMTLSFSNSDGSTFTHVIRGPSRGSALSQLEDFFKSDAGQTVFDEYVKALQSEAIFNFISGSQSPVGESVRANTMRALGESKTLLETRRASRGGANFSIGYEHTEFDNAYFSGESTTIPIQIGSRLSPVTDLQFRIPVTWTDLEGTEFYRFGLELDLGITLVGHQRMAPFEWEVTPTVGNFLVGTSDLMLGGDIYNYGVQNRLQWNTQATSFSYGVYWGQYESTSIGTGDLDADLQVDEEILSQGVKLAFRIGQDAVLDFYTIQSKPRSGIGYREVQTIGVMFNLNMGGAILQVGYAEDEGEDTENAKYEAERWVANLLFRF